MVAAPNAQQRDRLALFVGAHGLDEAFGLLRDRRIGLVVEDGDELVVWRVGAATQLNQVRLRLNAEFAQLDEQGADILRSSSASMGSSIMRMPGRGPGVSTG